MGPWGADLRGSEDREQLRGTRTGEGQSGAPPWVGNGWVGTPVLGSAWPRPRKIGHELCFLGWGRGAGGEEGSKSRGTEPVFLSTYYAPGLEGHHFKDSLPVPDSDQQACCLCPTSGLILSHPGNCSSLPSALFSPVMHCAATLI